MGNLFVPCGFFCLNVHFLSYRLLSHYNLIAFQRLDIQIQVLLWFEMAEYHQVDVGGDLVMPPLRQS